MDPSRGAASHYHDMRAKRGGYPADYYRRLVVRRNAEKGSREFLAGMMQLLRDLDTSLKNWHDGATVFALWHDSLRLFGCS